MGIEHFDELLNGDSNSGPPQLPTIHGPNPEEISAPTLGEIKTIISRLKNYKSPGSDGIAAEMLKAGGDVLHQHVYIIIRSYLKYGATRFYPTNGMKVLCAQFTRRET